MLPRALQSVLDQTPTFSDFEVIVVDDASTDDTPTVIVEWAEKFGAAGIPFRAFCLEVNSGAQASPKNRGLEMARGDYIRYLDDDNEFTPGSLKVLVDTAESGDTWVEGAYGRRTYVRDPDAPETTKDGVPLLAGDSPLIPFNPDRLASGCLNNYIDSSDFIMGRGTYWWIYQHTGMFWNESYRRFGDWELLTRATNLDRLTSQRAVKLREVDSIVSRYHWHATNLQHTRPLHETPVAKGVIDTVKS
jgi:glycosyltransferase involved in cell wall biosynthesis